MLESIENGSALKKFKEIITSQGGNLDNLLEETIADNATIIKSKGSGYIKSIKTDMVGWALVEIGAGRKKDSDKLDYLAGIEFIKKVGSQVNRGDPIFKIFGNDITRLNKAKEILQNTYSLVGKKVNKKKLIIN